MSSRRHVLLLLAALAVLARADIAAAQCTTYPVIPNFRTVSFSGLQWTMAWDPPAGAAPGTTYEFVQRTGTGYCHFSTNETVLATTTSTSFTANLSTPDIAYRFYVRLASDKCTRTEFSYVTDTFTSLPTKPVISNTAVGPSSVTVTFNYTDDRTFGVLLYRLGNDGKPIAVGPPASPCNPDPKTITDPNVPKGSYLYTLVASDAAGGVSSDAVTLSVGMAIHSFSAIPQTIHAGQSATLSWVTEGATSVVIDNGVGSQPVSGSVTVTPSATTTYTLSASSGASTMTATETVTVITTPAVAVSSPPAAMVQLENQGGARTSYILTNAGGAAATINLSQSGTFFTQTPTSLTLAPGASQVVTITASPMPAGAYEGTSLPSGPGVPAGLALKVKLLSTSPPSGTVTAKPAANRVDVAGAAGTSPTGSISFTNDKDATLTGILVADVPWIIPQPGLVSIPPHSTALVSFTIDRSQRPDADALLGSATGNLALAYLSGNPAPLDTTPTPTLSIVSVVDTVQLSIVTGTAPPPLGPGEVALFIPGAGHVTSTVGLFISDISVLNLLGNNAIDDLRFFFTPNGPGSVPVSTTLPPVATSVSLADVVKTVFGSDRQLGSLQVRSASASKISVNTNIFNTSNPAGTYGTTIPTFRSDRAVAAGDHLVLTGLRQDATAHTNLFIQEMSGQTVTVQTEFLDADGATLGTRSDTVGPFALAVIGGSVPTGAVAGILTNTSSGTATFLAYATPVDEASGDNWSVVDWSRQYGYSGTDPVIIPVAGVLRGANNTFFRTDFVITNTGSVPGSGTLRFYWTGGAPLDRQITLSPRHTAVFKNVIGDFIGGPSGSVGYLLFTPTSSSFALTSRTYTTAVGSVATFGTHVPTVSPADALTAGGVRAIASLQDSAIASITAGRPATFRTNFGMLETSGKSATVRVTLRYSYPAGVKLQAFGLAAKDYVLNPNEFRQISGIAGEIIGSQRSTLGDLRELEADFQVISGDGAVVIYTSSTDNGTGDVILRTQ